MSSQPQTDDHFWQALPLGRGVTVCARDAGGVVAFCKPAGVLSHPNEARDQGRSLLDARYVEDGEFYEWQDKSGTGCQPVIQNKAHGLAAHATTDKTHGLAAHATTRRLWLLNRLDSGTSGVILAASDEKLALEIRALFQQRRVSKTYVALVFGLPSGKKQVWRDRLAIEKRGGQIRAGARAGNIPAEAEMTVLRTWREHPFAGGRAVSLLQLEPGTGRSHQLRVQCARRRLPIVGDATYGDFRANREFAKRGGGKRLFLHSLETRFEYGGGAGREGRAGRVFAARAELPPEFLADGV